MSPERVRIVVLATLRSQSQESKTRMEIYYKVRIGLLCITVRYNRRIIGPLHLNRPDYTLKSDMHKFSHAETSVRSPSPTLAFQSGRAHYISKYTVTLIQNTARRLTSSRVVSLPK